MVRPCAHCEAEGVPVRREPRLEALRYTTAGSEFLAAIVGFAALGWLGGRLVGHAALGAGLGAVAGFAAGLYRLVRTARVWQAEYERKLRADRGDGEPRT